MRDLTSCYNEYAVQVSDSVSCSSYANSTASCISPNLTVPSIQNAVTCLYKTIFSNQNQLFIRVTWSKTNVTQGLSIQFGDDPSNSFKLSTNSRLFRKKKGSKSCEFNDYKVEVLWDLSAAKYNSAGPEPINGYYVLVKVDSEFGLILGDLAEEALLLKKLKNGTSPVAKFYSISRQEHFSGKTTLYSTKAQFCDNGSLHDILIRCSGENERLKHPVLSVYIDKKMVIKVKRLQWNFRGNQTIFLDGLLIDFMWDVHDMFFNLASSGSYAVFMFRTRSGMNSRLWLEDKILQKDHQDKVEFSFLICASRCP